MVLYYKTFTQIVQSFQGNSELYFISDKQNRTNNEIYSQCLKKKRNALHKTHFFSGKKEKSYVCCKLKS